jgi:hypothetical protein
LSVGGGPDVANGCNDLSPPSLDLTVESRSSSQQRHQQNFKSLKATMTFHRKKGVKTKATEMRPLTD